MREIGSSLRDTALQGVKQVTADTLAGRNIKSSINNSISRARADIARTIENDLDRQQGKSVAAATTVKPGVVAASAKPAKKRRLVQMVARRRIPVKRMRRSVFEDLTDDDDDNGGGNISR